MAAIPGPAREPSGAANLERAAPPRAERVEIVAITSDDLLLEQIGQSLDGESTVRQADSPAEARGFLRPSQPSVLLLDARGHEDLAAVVQDLQSLNGTSIVVLFAPADSSADIARAVRGSAAFAVLPIPIVPAQTTAVIEGACEECLARHALLAVPSPAPVRDDRVAAPSPAPTNAAPPVAAIAAVRASAQLNTDHRSRFLVVGACVALLAATAAWFWLHDPAAPRKSPSTSPQPHVAESSNGSAAGVVTPGALQAGSLDELLESARAAMRERRYTDPEGSSALNYFRSVLALDPGNGEAREGLQRVAAVLHERVQAALAARQIDEAARTLAQLRSLRPDDAAIASFAATIADARIQKALAEPDVERARELLKQAAATGTLPPDAVTRWRTELDRQQAVAHAEQLAQLVSLRIRQGQLLEPAGDSAKHYLAQLRGLPTSPRGLVADATTQLQQACLDKFRDALAGSQRPEADRWKAEARGLGVSANELAAVQRDVSARSAVSAARKEAARVAQLVQDRIADGRLLEPSNDSAVFHLNTLRTLDPSGNTVAASERALSAKLLEQGRGALTEGRLNVARDDAAAARALGLNLDNVTALERDIAGAGPDGPSTSHPAAALTRTRYVAPEYPKSALAQHVRGDVRLRLTVDAEGKVSDAVVIQANPPKVFDAAAIAAARRWRFKPIGAKGSGVEATVTVGIVFQPEDAQP